VGEQPIDATDGFIAGFEGVEDAGFDAAGAGSGERKSDAVFGLKNPAEKDLGFLHAVAEPGVHVADERRGESAIDARVDGGGAGSHHQACGRLEFAHGIGHWFTP